MTSPSGNASLDMPHASRSLGAVCGPISSILSRRAISGREDEGRHQTFLTETLQGIKKWAQPRLFLHENVVLPVFRTHHDNTLGVGRKESLVLAHVKPL